MPPMKAYLITDGFNVIYVPTPDDARLVKSELDFGSWASGKRYTTTVAEVEINAIPENDQKYLEWLRDTR